MTIAIATPEIVEDKTFTKIIARSYENFIFQTECGFYMIRFDDEYIQVALNNGVFDKEWWEYQRENPNVLAGDACPEFSLYRMVEYFRTQYGDPSCWDVWDLDTTLDTKAIEQAQELQKFCEFLQNKKWADSYLQLYTEFVVYDNHTIQLKITSDKRQGWVGMETELDYYSKNWEFYVTDDETSERKKIRKFCFAQHWCLNYFVGQYSKD